MSNKRRIFLIVISVTIGMGLSVIIFLMKNKGKALSDMDYLWLGTNLFFFIADCWRHRTLFYEKEGQ
ncbi:MAG: hypothetical protein IPJ93_08330 [Bacteroidota bacterium]|nr:MAG: hypothetical protein IPJ93_08330 [Bacteroidota bacterium]